MIRHVSQQTGLVATGDARAWKRFGAWVTEQREALDLLKTELAEEAGISRSKLADIESGGRTHKGTWVVESPSPRILRKLAKGLGLDPDALMSAPEIPNVRAMPRPIPLEERAEMDRRLARVERLLEAIAKANGVTVPPLDQEEEATR